MILSHDEIIKLARHETSNEGVLSTDRVKRAQLANKFLKPERIRLIQNMTPFARHTNLRAMIEVVFSPSAALSNMDSLALREAITGSRSPNHGFSDQDSWRITWDDFICELIPEEFIDELSGWLFATSLLSMVRHYNVYDQPQLASKFDVQFSAPMEQILQPVYGILSGYHSVTYPVWLPTRIMDRSRGLPEQRSPGIKHDQYLGQFGEAAHALIKHYVVERQDLDEAHGDRADHLLHEYQAELMARYQINPLA